MQTVTPQSPQILLIEKLKQAGCGSDAIQIWQQMSNEVELVGSKYVYDNYYHPHKSARRNFFLAFGALLHRFYIEDVKENCIQMGIDLLKSVFYVEPDYEETSYLEDYPYCYNNDLVTKVFGVYGLAGIGAFQVIDGFRSESQELDDSRADSDIWNDYFNISRVIWKRVVDESDGTVWNRGYINFWKVFCVTLARNENAFGLAYRIACDELNIENYDELLAELGFLPLSEALRKKIRANQFSFETPWDELHAIYGEKFLNHCSQ